MTYEEFLELVDNADRIPDGLTVHQEALWYDRRGDWQRAHDLIDHLDDRTSARVHAYLHRVEGDMWNARYWYSRAGESPFSGSLDEEWVALVRRLV
ncbi:hypothetical protein BC792_10250 [Sphingobacterium allocomposti]|uniref:Uncharacterized protein n=1 Tax=Sphingobacterium allocomposti TaxID=415956 RepID=A0A5S5DSJ6_9SPHI|nr:hypothetical protein [Sphingobacterium composti Yoo et al. 2007 non Ten et al. 2007]TYP97629.1 hypothetical protein BC792_10250 [Sphingobacterium composti Yoo et al. 2007 non Ten et al. 2007]